MENQVGFRFSPNDEEIVDHYLRLKNLDGSTSLFNKVISTINISTMDPWDLPSESRDQIWYFFRRKENKYNRGNQQIRKTKSGFWKKTGKTKDILRKKGNGEKIGEKKVLVFKLTKNQTGRGSKSDWVMHEYHSTFLSPNQTATYVFCKVEFKGDDRDMSLVPHMNNSGGLSSASEGLSFASLHNQELENPRQEEAQLDDEMGRTFNSYSDDEWDNMFKDQSKVSYMQEDFNNYRPKKPLIGVFSDHSSDDTDSEPTSSIQSSSTCVSFGSSNHHQVDQIKDLPEESLNSGLKSQKVSKTQGSSTDTSEKKVKAQGFEMIKNKRDGFFYRLLKKLVKKTQLCCSIART